MKKSISILLSFIMVLSTLSFSINAYAKSTLAFEGSLQNSPFGEITEIKNDVKSTDDGRLFSFSKLYADVPETDGEIYSVYSAAEKLRDAMINREETFAIEIYNGDEQPAPRDVFYLAISEELYTTPKSGDYLKFLWNGVNFAGWIRTQPNGVKTYIFKFTVTYHTTLEQEKMVDAEVDRIINDYNLKNLSQLEQISTIYNYLCSNITYDLENVNQGFSHTAYAGLINKTCVCQGYALSFYRLCRELGIDSRIIASDNHGWNIVELNGVYYNVDSTWDAEVYSQLNTYHYFMCCPDHFENHDRLEEYITDEFNARYPMASECLDYEAYLSCEHSFVYSYAGNKKHQVTCTKCNMTESMPCNMVATTNPATCTTAGSVTSTCSVCAGVDNEKLEPLGHDFSSYSSNDDATCTDDGTKTSTCTRCGEASTIADEGSALGHSFTNYISNDDATCTDDGTKHAICDRCSNEETVIDEGSALGHDYKKSITRATLSKNGSIITTCERCGNIGSNTAIAYPKAFTLSSTKYTYDGKVKKPTVTVKDSKGKTIASTNYTVSYPSGMKNVGKYTVKITFKGNYSGTKSLSYTIVPKSTTISKLTADSKGFTATWKKQATQTTGYEIQYSTSSKFTSPKTVAITKNSTVSKKITKLTAKKKYYVRIRTYKTVSGTKYYSSWSASKYVTTKK